MCASDTWITGVGTVNPLGSDYATFADNLLAGRSGIRGVPAEMSPTKTEGFVGRIELGPPAGWDAAAFESLNRLEQVVVWCCVHALRDAGWWPDRASVRMGLVLGLGAEWLRVWEMDWLAGGNRVLTPRADEVPVLQKVQHELGLSGPIVPVAAACASGNIAMAQARRLVERGWVDVCLAGGCDLITPLAMAGFGNLRALATRADHPAAASRPFDQDRNGFVMGEGGGVLVIERAETARRRGARPYAAIAGFGATSDAHHMVIPSPRPHAACLAMRRALDDAGVAPEEIDYLNAHATGTPVGDCAEAAAIRMAFGEAAECVSVSSTKSMTGHLLSGAAAIEAIACLIALERQTAPPTINLDHPDPECQLHHVQNQARPRTIRAAMSNSIGFGGSNTSLILRQVA